MSNVRPPAVAGRFYPADATALRGLVREYLSNAVVPANARAPKALIVPHAGYIYSGPVAASAYALLAMDRATIRRIVLLGPSHRHAFHGLAAPAVDWFETPLGLVPIDTAALSALARFPQVAVMEAAHHGEHSLEVHVPFLQEVLGEFALVPLAVGDASAAEVADVLEALWDGPETRIVVSSDLSHYLAYHEAMRRDRETSSAIEELRPEALQFDDACGRVPIAGLLTVAKARGLTAETVDLRNSGDTAGPRTQVVGYGAYVFN